MALPSQKERDKKEAKSMAEEWHLSKEDKMPNLQEKYWANPNAQKGQIARCSYYTNGKERDVHAYEEGN